MSFNNSNEKIQMTFWQRQHFMSLFFLIPFLMGMGVDLYVPSLPIITHYFNVNQSLVQLTIGLYMFGYAFGQLFLGILSDSIGRKKVMIFSAVLYVVVSFLSAFSPNVYALIFFRLLQGIGIAGVAAINRAMAADCFSDLKLIKILSYVSTSWALGPIVGPFIGSYLQHYFNWQADFYFFALYGLFILIEVSFFMPETHFDREAVHLIKMYQKMKVVISHPIFLISSIIISLVYALGVVFNVVGPFLIQGVLHYSVLSYGRIALMLGVGYFMGNFVNRILMQYFEVRNIILAGLFGTLLLSLVFILLGVFIPLNLAIIFVPVLFIFFFSAFVISNASGIALSYFKKTAGTASALRGFLSAAGVFVASSLAALLKTHSQMPLAFMYFGMVFICLVLFFIGRRIENR